MELKKPSCTYVTRIENDKVTVTAIFVNMDGECTSGVYTYDSIKSYNRSYVSDFTGLRIRNSRMPEGSVSAAISSNIDHNYKFPAPSKFSHQFCGPHSWIVRSKWDCSLP